MPIITAAGDIISVNGKAGFKEGIVKGEVGGRARVSYEAKAEFCHGLDVALNAKALSAVRGELVAFLPALRLQGNAFAAAGIHGQVKIAPDLFDKFGLTLNVKAHAEAAVAGSIALGLDFEQIAQLARKQLSGVAFEIFMAFLNEARVEMGLWGKAAFSAMAGAWLEVNGSFKDEENAGFVIKAGFDAGWGAGTGWDFYGGIAFDNPKRFYKTATGILTREIIRENRKHLPAKYGPVLSLAEFVMPTAFVFAYDLGQLTLHAAMASQDRKAGSFNEIFLRELQDFLLAQTVALGEKLLEESIDQVSAYLFNGILDEKELQTLRTHVKALADELARGELSLDRLPVIMTRALAIAEILGEPYLSEQRRPLAILWTALTASFAIRNATVKANVSISLVAAGTAATGGHMVYLPSHHGVGLLEEEFTSFFGPDAPDRLDLGQAIDYLICGAGIDRLIVEHLPQLALFFQLLEERLDLTPGDIISGGIEGSIQRDFSTTELYQKVKGFVQETTETFILAQLVPAIRQNVPKTYQTRIYMDEVVEPSLLIMSRFAFEKVDLFVKAGVTPDSVLQPLNKGLSTVVCKIMVRNVVVLGDILIMQAVAQLGHGFGQFEQDLRSNRGQAMLNGSVQLLQDLLPMQHLSPQKLKAPVRDLLIALMRAGKKAHGPQVWTRKRRDEFRRRMINLLLSVDGNADYASTDAMDRFFREMTECAFIPNVDELLALHRLCMEILGNEMAIFQTHALPALTKFHLAVSQAAVREMDQAAQKVMRQAARHLDALYRAYLEAQARARKLAQALQQAIAEHTRLLKALTKTFGSAAQRNELLKKIKSDGLKEVERLTKASADYRLLPAPLKKAKVVAARKTFQTAWAVAGPQISLGLKCLNEVAKTLSDLVAKAPNVTALTQNVSKQIEKEVQQAVKKALKVALPPRLSFRGMARSVANAILGNTLIKKQLKDVVAQKAVQRQAAKQHQSGVKTQEQREQRWRAQKSQLDHLKGGPLAVVIGSPRSTTVYHKQVKLDITVKGANNSFVDPSTRRILVMLNGFSLPGAGRNWKRDARQKALRLRQTLAFNKRLFRDGVNLIECSVVDGRGRTIRETKAFQLWHV